MLGVTKATISRWESGERFPDREFWPRIKETTGIGIEELAAPSTEKGAAA
jgi:transcriptional regulator with XRE-family HTH domain